MTLFEINMMYISVFLIFYIGLWLITPYFHNELTNAKYFIFTRETLIIVLYCQPLFTRSRPLMIISVSVATFLYHADLF